MGHTTFLKMGLFLHNDNVNKKNLQNVISGVFSSFTPHPQFGGTVKPFPSSSSLLWQTE